jgi:hypothetical protein
MYVLILEAKLGFWSKYGPQTDPKYGTPKRDPKLGSH